MAGSGAEQGLRRLVAALAALNVGLVVAWIATRGVEPEAPPATGSRPVAESAGAAATELGLLRAELARAGEQRAQLEQRVARLDEELALLRGRAAPDAPAVADEAPPAEPEPEAAPEGEVFLADSLRELGLADYEVERLRSAWEQWELEKLYAHDEARREGYVMRPRHRQQLNEIRLEMRRELGDEDFDRLLYGSGQSNRVIVTNVLEGSAASEAGLVPGDVVVGYDDRRIFRAWELRNLTGGGDAGELVPVDVAREEGVVRFYLPRGPMGLMLNEERRSPPPS